MSDSKVFILGLKPYVDDPALLTTEQLYECVGRNTGNLAFAYAIFLHLSRPNRFVSWRSLPKVIDAAGNLGVIPAANQLGKHANYARLAERFSQLNTKMTMIGLGAQSGIDGKIPEVPEGTVQWVREIIQRAPSDKPNISVRGHFTKSVLDHYGLGKHAVVLGCPSLFINSDPELGRMISARIRPIRRIAVVAGTPSWKHLSKIEASLAAMVTATGGSYVGQHGIEMLHLTRGEARNLEEKHLLNCRDFTCPQMSLDEFIRWSERYGNVFWHVPSWMEHYRRFDFVVGARIHGIMLALQAGVPALCVVHDSRTLELCQTMMIPHVLARDISSGVTRDELLALFQFDAKAFDANRRNLAKRYVEFLEQNNLEPVSWLRDIGSNCS